MNMKRCGKKPSWNNLSCYSCLCTETLVRLLMFQYVKVLSWFIPSSSSLPSSSSSSSVTCQTLTNLFRPRLIVSSKMFQVVFVHLVYNSALLLTFCCSFFLHVVAKLIWICLVSLQLVLLSTVPKYLHLFCGRKGCTWQFFWKISCRLMLFVFYTLFLRVKISLPCKRTGTASELYTFMLLL